MPFLPSLDEQVKRARTVEDLYALRHFHMTKRDEHTVRQYKSKDGSVVAAVRSDGVRLPACLGVLRTLSMLETFQINSN